jgi:8-oxo-dGTP diphosphatase
MNRPKVGVAVFLIKENKLLLGKRIGSHGAHSWGPPGGHLEFGETVSGCAQRELFEETGLEIAACTIVGFTNDIFVDEKKHYITLYVKANYQGGELLLKEPEKCAQWQWFASNELPTPLFLPIQNFLKIYDMHSIF